MKYMARLEGVEGLDKPVQAFGRSFEALKELAREWLKQYSKDRYPEAQVVIYREQLVVEETVKG